MCREPTPGRLPAMTKLRRTLLFLTVVAGTLGLTAVGAFGDGESLSDRLNTSRLFNSANCALTGNDCSAPKPPSTGTEPTPGTGPTPGGGKALPRGKTDVGVFEFTVSGKQTTTWNYDE